MLVHPIYLTLQHFVLGLSILLRGSLEDKLRWTFSLYDQDKDGYISRLEEFTFPLQLVPRQQRRRWKLVVLKGMSKGSNRMMDV